VLGLPRSAVPSGDAAKQILMDQTTLTAAKHTLHPVDIQFRAGPTVDVFLVFPRLLNLSIDDKEIELSIKHPPIAFKEKFRLKEMLFGGKLEL